MFAPLALIQLAAAGAASRPAARSSTSPPTPRSSTTRAGAATARAKAALDQLTATLAAEEPRLRCYASIPATCGPRCTRPPSRARTSATGRCPKRCVPALLRLLEHRPPSGRYRRRADTADRPHDRAHRTSTPITATRTMHDDDARTSHPAPGLSCPADRTAAEPAERRGLTPGRGPAAGRRGRTGDQPPPASTTCRQLLRPGDLIVVNNSARPWPAELDGDRRRRLADRAAPGHRARRRQLGGRAAHRPGRRRADPDRPGRSACSGSATGPIRWSCSARTRIRSGPRCAPDRSRQPAVAGPGRPRRLPVARLSGLERPADQLRLPQPALAAE